MQITRSYQSPSPDNMKYESSQYRTAVPAQTTYPSSSLPSPPHHWDYQPAQQNYIPSTQAPLSPAASDPDMNQVWISSESDLHINIHTSGSEAPVYYRQQDLYNTAQYPSPSQSSFKSRATSLVSTYSTSQTSMDRTPIRKATTSPTQKKKKTTSESGGKVYCDICQKGFGRRWNLTSHKKNTHEPNQVRPFPCTGFMESGEPCTRAFKRKTDCTRHFESVCILPLICSGTSKGSS